MEATEKEVISLKKIFDIPNFALTREIKRRLEIEQHFIGQKHFEGALRAMRGWLTIFA